MIAANDSVPNVNKIAIENILKYASMIPIESMFLNQLPTFN